MSKKTPTDLFAAKAKKFEASLGEALGKLEYDNDKNRHFQRFEHGIILGRFNDISKDSDLICIYGRLFDAWWRKPDAVWLGEPLEDLYETTNYEGFQLMVQRFENGVISCRSDGSYGVNWLSWRDWNALSEPGNKSDKHR